MTMPNKFNWSPGDLVPDWLSLTPDEQRATLLELLRHSQLSRHEQANRMLIAAPWPSDETDAEARAATVINYLTEGRKMS